MRKIEHPMLAAALAGILNGVLCEVAPDIRKAVFEGVANGYCTECGDEKPPGTVCHCQNDE